MSGQVSGNESGSQIDLEFREMQPWLVAAFAGLFGVIGIAGAIGAQIDHDGLASPKLLFLGLGPFVFMLYNWSLRYMAESFSRRLARATQGTVQRILQDGLTDSGDPLASLILDDPLA